MSNIWFIGPLGWDFIFSVKTFPQEDFGAVCYDMKIGVCSDAPITALNLSIPASKIVIGNKIGESEEAKFIKDVLIRSSIQLIEELNDSPSFPIDVVIESDKGTRTWISNITPPMVNDWFLNMIKLLEQKTHPNLIYLDYWEDPSFDILLNAIYRLNPSILYLNYGDCKKIESIKKYLAYKNILIQVSDKDSTSEIASYNDLGKLDQQTIIVTRGPRSIFLITSAGQIEIPVKALSNTVIGTTGAGALFSAHLIDELCTNEKHSFNDLVKYIKYSTNKTQEKLITNNRNFIFSYP